MLLKIGKGCPEPCSTTIYAALERRGDAIHFHPRLLELCAHYHFAARPFTTLEAFNRQALGWRDREAHARRWPGGDYRTVAEAFAEEKPRLLSLPVHQFDSDLLVPVRSGKTIYVRFDLNDYSIPPGFVGWRIRREQTRHRAAFHSRGRRWKADCRG
jgi:hypothetical protein